MPGETVPEGSISRAEIAELAELFDQFSHALNPHSTEAQQAESRFNDLALDLYETRVKNVVSAGYPEFSRYLRHYCREFLKRNRP